MNLFSLAKKYITNNYAASLIQIFSLSIAIGILILIINLTNQFSDNFKNNNNIDAVLGAKGSPLQLILSTIYLSDIPNGNINYQEAIKLTKLRAIKNAAPISLGDNYKNYPIIGTNDEYFKIANLKIKVGAKFNKPMEAVIGFNVAKNLNLKIGDEFYSNHGTGGSAHIHKEKIYKIVGVLEQNNSVSDRIILTNLDSIWLLHEDEHHEEEHNQHNKEHGHEEYDNHEHDTLKHHHGEIEDFNEKEITALLIKYKNRASAFNFPKLINKETNMQVASPNLEVARFFKNIGVGLDSLKIIAYILLILSIIGIFLILFNNTKKRYFDLAILRINGASNLDLIKLVFYEGFIIIILSIIFGIFLSRLILFLITKYVLFDSFLYLKIYSFYVSEIYFLIIFLSISIISVILPSIIAAKVNLDKLIK